MRANIKRGRGGGLTEELVTTRQARRWACVCEIVDWDGPLFLARDRSLGAIYGHGSISIPQPFLRLCRWGDAAIRGCSLVARNRGQGNTAVDEGFGVYKIGSGQFADAHTAVQ